MLWIGLTGGIASGKSTVAKILRELGYPVVEADALAHLAYNKNSDGYKQIVHNFGRDILDRQENIDRKKLGQLVFSDKKKLALLESLIHPLVQELALREKISLEEKGFAAAFYEVPLLFEKNLQSKFDCTVLVSTSDELQRSRLKARNQMTDAEIDSRIASQLPLKVKKEKSDFIIQNDQHEAELKLEVEKMVNYCLSRN